jgi:hypothetical protein
VGHADADIQVRSVQIKSDQRNSIGICLDIRIQLRSRRQDLCVGFSRTY